ncbi:hypothetical protein CAEBREN_25318 [Caenorhabditis brenneri]|uniref:Uncharacterized protein n=1 Tax=Caenorhabditis brenneri TaxID=135651 RepID=G0MJT0_CAEBE|nr:hypothetical protein CAEBREN_25318 [Caenorhabditis brenneri]
MITFSDFFCAAATTGKKILSFFWSPFSTPSPPANQPPTTSSRWYAIANNSNNGIYAMGEVTGIRWIDSLIFQSLHWLHYFTNFEFFVNWASESLSWLQRISDDIAIIRSLSSCELFLSD